MIFKTLDFKPLVFGTFAEASTNVGEFVELAMEYGVEHIGRTMAATSLDSMKAALTRMYKIQLATTAWKGYANLVLDMTKYEGTGSAKVNKVHFRKSMNARAHEGEFI